MTGLGLGVSSLQKIILIITGILLNCPGRTISDRILPIHQHHNSTGTTVSQSRVVLIGKVDCVVVSEVTLSYQSTAHNWPPRSKYPMSGWGGPGRVQSLPRNYRNWKSLSLKLLKTRRFHKNIHPWCWGGHYEYDENHHKNLPLFWPTCFSPPAPGSVVQLTVSRARTRESTFNRESKKLKTDSYYNTAYYI